MGSHSPVELDQLVGAVVATGVPGSLAHTAGPSGTRSAAAGLADLAAGRALGPGERFPAGSVTKTFVAAVVLQLVDEGLLRLDGEARPSAARQPTPTAHGFGSR